IRALAGENNKHQLQLEAARDQLDAERAWDSLLRYIEQWGADLAPLFHGRDANGDPILERPEPLPPEVAWAVQQCGGYRAVANAESDKLHFIRKDFIRHYSRHRETDQLRVPSREEAKQLVSRVDGWRKKLVEQPRPPLVKRSS
nr:hypothetical protein [Anaerolineae bacterium]